MWNPTKEEIASIIERCVGRVSGPNEWDDFISSSIPNPCLEKIQSICATIDLLYPPSNSRALTSKAGEDFLLRVASALRNKDEAGVLESIQNGNL
jgi:hypothetical protein